MGNDTSTLSNKEEFRVDGNRSGIDATETNDANGDDDDTSSTASHTRLHRPTAASSILTGRLRSERSTYAKSVSSNVSVHNVDVSNPAFVGRNHAASGTSSVAEEGEDTEDPGCCRSSLDKINTFRNFCGALVNDSRVQLFVVMLIAVNAILMGVGTFRFVRDNPRIEKTFETTDLAFLIFFSVELGMQFIYHGIYLFLDVWLVFDFLIILMSWSLSGVQVIRAFRIFRALRLITRVKTMKNLILALFSVMPRMVAIFMMLGLLFYIFGVMFTQLFKDLYAEGITDFDYFSRMDHTLLTLFQMMTLDGWGELTRAITAQPEYSWAVIPMTVFVILSGFVIANLFIAVICDAVSALQEEEKDRLHGWKPKKRKKIPATGRATFGDGTNLLEPAIPAISLDNGSHIGVGRGTEMPQTNAPPVASELDYVNMNSLDRLEPPQPSSAPPSVMSKDDEISYESDDDDLCKQIEFVEDRIEELTRIQATTFDLLQRMTRALQAHKAGSIHNHRRDDTDATISSSFVA